QELINIAKDVGVNTRIITRDIKNLSKKINEGKGIIGELVTDGEIAIDIRDAVNEIKKTTQQTSLASQNLNGLLYKLNNGNGLINQLATDTSMVYAFKETLQYMREVGE